MGIKKLSKTEIELIAQKIVNQTYRPSSVYRIQFNQEFPYSLAMEYLDYYRELGVDAIYSSPCLQAVSGSLHGYNITNPHQINPEIGSYEEFTRFSKELGTRGLSMILDIVPNHMGIKGSSNQIWMDVLENGPSSIYADFFDIDWYPVKDELENKILIPILGDQFGFVLENKELQIHYDNGRFFLQYWENSFPIAPKTYPMILQYRILELEEAIGKDHPDYLQFLSAITAFKNLPDRTITAPDIRQERHREIQFAKQRLGQVYSQSEVIQAYIHSSLESINGTVGLPESFNFLEEVLQHQSYRLASWKVAGEEINYRRFFDINELAAIRMEDERVFEYYHQFIFRLIAEGHVKGLRIDHSDGLYDPPEYFQKLQYRGLQHMVTQEIHAQYGEETLLDDYELSECLVRYSHSKPLYVVIEKILERKETLPEDWKIYGTVGYEFLNAMNGLMIVRQNERAFTEIYQKFTAIITDYEEQLYHKKKFITKALMSGEINTLGHMLENISERSRYYRDFTLNDLTTAIREVIACFPVYRTYISPRDNSVSERDEQYIHIAIEKAKRKNDFIHAMVYDFIRDILLLRLDNHLSVEDRQLYRNFILRFQQITSPIMAKGAEDTVFYLNNRFLSLNEVGSNPSHFGYSIQEFHKQNLERLRKWRYSLITNSTHDTKRSLDIRMRLDVLSEIPNEWSAFVTKCSRINKKHRVLIENQWIPRKNTEYFLYQTLIGVWPDYPIEDDYRPQFMERIWLYIQKALREAKTFTSWTKPDYEYEDGIRQFVFSILDKKKGKYFLRFFLDFQKNVAGFGMLNSLSATTLTIGSPGVPDIYQGTELWDYSLVDPDNRRPVDYNLRRYLLYRVRSLMDADIPLKNKTLELMLEKRDSRIKIFNLWKALNFRKKYSELFLEGNYYALEVSGSFADNVVAFAKKQGNQIVIVVAGRFFTSLVPEHTVLPLGKEIWKDTVIHLHNDLECRSFVDIYTGASISVARTKDCVFLPAAKVFEHFSFSMLTTES